MTSWETWYWRVFNVSVRALGLVTLLSGAALAVLGVIRMLEMDYIRLEESSSLVILPIGLLAAALGWALLRTPAYRPDLGDVSWRFDPFGKQAGRSPASRRSWWTGDGRA